MAVLRAHQLPPLRPGGPPAVLLDWAAACWHRGDGDWAVVFRAAADRWAVDQGVTLADGEPDLRRMTELGVRRPRRLRGWVS